MVFNVLANAPFLDAMERNTFCKQCKNNHRQNDFQPARVRERVHGNP